MERIIQLQCMTLIYKIETKLNTEILSTFMMELLPWVKSKENKLCSTQLNVNPSALEYIMTHNIPQFPLILSLNSSPDLINHIIKNKNKLEFNIFFKTENIFENLITCSRVIKYERGILLNPLYIKLIEKNFHLLNKTKRDVLYANPAALHLLDLRPKSIEWDYLSSNTNPIAIKLLKENIDKIYWTYLSANPAAIEILTENQDKIIFRTLASNPNAITLIKKYMHRIDLVSLCYNTNPEIIDIIESQLDKLTNWGPLSENPSAIKILQKNQDKIMWYFFSQNPAIFEYNYLKMAEERMRLLREELMMKSLHPSRIARLIELGCDIDDL